MEEGDSQDKTEVKNQKADSLKRPRKQKAQMIPIKKIMRTKTEILKTT